MLSSIFTSGDDINKLVNRFIKKIYGCIKINFRKVRTTKAKESKLDNLYTKMDVLKQRDDDKSKEDIAKVIEAITQEEENKYLLLMSELNKLNPDVEGKMYAQKFWNINKNIFPRSRKPQDLGWNKSGSWDPGSHIFYPPSPPTPF